MPAANVNHLLVSMCCRGCRCSAVLCHCCLSKEKIAKNTKNGVSVPWWVMGVLGVERWEREGAPASAGLSRWEPHIFICRKAWPSSPR